MYTYTHIHMYIRQAGFYRLWSGLVFVHLYEATLNPNPPPKP